MKWDKWVGNNNHEPVFFTKHLLHLFGCRIDLHKMVKADDPGCFHTHPAHAIRIVLWGGYWEQWVTGMSHDGELTDSKLIRPGHIGHIRPEFEHRIAWLPKGVSYSLWLRGPVIAKVKFGCD